jgi:hypothetical protein
MLVTLIAAGILLARARLTYASDVASAAASDEGAKRPAAAATAVARPRTA